ncbi:MAG: phosphatase PAP2 family protein [Steroidobacteraceae bacterium]
MKATRTATLALLAGASLPLSGHAANDPDLMAGDILQYAVPAAALVATWHFDDSEGRWELLKDYGATMVSAYALKAAFNHTSWGTRPNGGDYSFPSGHTASACAGGFFLEERYGWAWGAPALAAALYTGYTRVDEHDHYVRDVVAGCALAYGFSRLFVDRRVPAGLSLTPTLLDHGAALTFNWQF